MGARDCRDIVVNQNEVSNFLLKQTPITGSRPVIFGVFGLFHRFALISSRLAHFSRVLLVNNSGSPVLECHHAMALQNKLSIKDLDLNGKRVFIRVGTYKRYFYN